MKKVLLFAALACVLIMVSCKPDADVQKWFNSGNLIELEFDCCDLVNPEAFNQVLNASSNKYLFKYDKLTKTAWIQTETQSLKLENVSYNKFRSDATQITLQNDSDDNPAVRFVIFPAGKDYVMSMYCASYRKGVFSRRMVFDSWTIAAYFAQDEGSLPSVTEGLSNL